MGEGGLGKFCGSQQALRARLPGGWSELVAEATRVWNRF